MATHWTRGHKAPLWKVLICVSPQIKRKKTVPNGSSVSFPVSCFLTLCNAQCRIHPHPHLNILLCLIPWGVIGPLAEPDVCSYGGGALAAVQETDEDGERGSYRLDVLQVHLRLHLVRRDTTVRRAEKRDWTMIHNKKKQHLLCRFQQSQPEWVSPSQAVSSFPARPFVSSGCSHVSSLSGTLGFLHQLRWRWSVCKGTTHPVNQRHSMAAGWLEWAIEKKLEGHVFICFQPYKLPLCFIDHRFAVHHVCVVAEGILREQFLILKLLCKARNRSRSVA